MSSSRYRSILLAVCALAVLGGNPSPTFAADSGQEAVLREGSTGWNAMRKLKPSAPVDLAGAKLKGRRLREIDLSRANLAGADLSQSDFGGSDFRDADLHGVTLDETFLGASSMSGADFARASLAGISAAKADFSGAKMASSVLRRAELTEARFGGADLRGADLRQARLEYADLGKADLRAANFWLASTGGANFSGALISEETVLPTGKPGSAKWAAEYGAVFMPVVKLAAQVRQVGIPLVALPSTKGEEAPAEVLARPLASPPEAEAGQRPAALPTTAESSAPTVTAEPPLASTLKPLRAWRPDPASVAYDGDQYEQLKSNVTKWNRLRKESPEMTVSLSEALLSNRVLACADLHGADLRKASFKRTDLDEADFRGANLQGADLRSANLQHVDFRRADLRGANLWLANTGSTKFDGALVSAETVLDSGKAATRAWAEEHGARFTDEP